MSTPCLLPARRNAQKGWARAIASPAARRHYATRRRRLNPAPERRLVHRPPSNGLHCSIVPLPSRPRAGTPGGQSEQTHLPPGPGAGSAPTYTRHTRSPSRPSSVGTMGLLTCGPQAKKAWASTLKATFPRVNCGLGSVPQFSWGCCACGRAPSLSLVFYLAAIQIPQQRPLSSSPSRARSLRIGA